MKKSLTKFFVVSSIVLGGVLLTHESVNASFFNMAVCSQVSCKTKMGLGKCISSRYKGSADYATVHAKDPNCSNSAAVLCASNGCDLSSIGFDCAGSSDSCPVQEEEASDADEAVEAQE